LNALENRKKKKTVLPQQLPQNSKTKKPIDEENTEKISMDVLLERKNLVSPLSVPPFQFADRTSRADSVKKKKRTAR